VVWNGYELLPSSLILSVDWVFKLRIPKGEVAEAFGILPLVENFYRALQLIRSKLS
jgi:hypothetical protein